MPSRNANASNNASTFLSETMDFLVSSVVGGEGARSSASTSVAQSSRFVIHTAVARPQLFPVSASKNGSTRASIRDSALASSPYDASNSQERDERNSGEEFLYLDYTAIMESTKAIDQEEQRKRFEIEDFAFVHSLKSYGRDIKICLCVTMYNEDITLFIKSITAIRKNIEYLCKPENWGSGGWKNFVVVIVGDGAAQMNPKVKLALEIMGIFDESLTLPKRGGQTVSAHLFQRTTNVFINSSMGVEYKSTPMQTIVLLKQKNAKKINSHRWFFTGICQKLNPKICFMLDVGTKPTPSSFHSLYMAFEADQHLGGACGEITVELGVGCSNLLNPLIAAQNFEYKMSNILDKSLESIFGYVSVLPGAFSAYRWVAIQGAPLTAYFHGELPSADIQSANLFLAEDRILCWQVVSKPNCKWVLKYIPSARAETDAPDNLPELIAQRKRWVNGSFFAALHALYNFSSIFKTRHSVLRKLGFCLQAIYNSINLLIVWFSIGNFYITFYGLFDTRKGANNQYDRISDPFYPYGTVVIDSLQVLYFFGLLAVLVSSLGNRPKGSKILYTGMSFFFVLLMSLMLFMSGWAIRNAFLNLTAYDFQNILAEPEFRDIVIGLGTSYVAYVVASIAHLDVWHLFTSQIQYLLIFPTYINIFITFAFCNIHDASWGTKNSSTVESSIPLASSDAVNNVHDEDRVLHYNYGEDLRSTAWSEACALFKDMPNSMPVKKNMREIQEDYERSFRTTIVIWWISCNVGLIYIFTSPQIVLSLFPQSVTLNPYLTFLFWTMAALSTIRLIGSLIFVVRTRTSSMARNMKVVNLNSPLKLV